MLPAVDGFRRWCQGIDLISDSHRILASATRWCVCVASPCDDIAVYGMRFCVAGTDFLVSLLVSCGSLFVKLGERGAQFSSEGPFGSFSCHIVELDLQVRLQ